MQKNQILSVLSILAIGFTTASCSTTPDPAKICTPEWIAPRAEKAIKKIESKTKKTMQSLRKVGDAVAEGKQPSVFTMMRFSSSLEKLEKELTEGRGISDIKLLASTCDDPKILTKSFRRVFESQGISTKVLDFIENTNLYKNIIRENLKDINSETNAVSGDISIKS